MEITTAKLALFLDFGASEVRVLQDILKRSGVEKGKQGYDFNAAIKAIVEWYRRRSELEVTVNTEELAGFIGLSERRVQQLAADGIIERPEEKGQYKVKSAVRAIVGHLREQAAGLPAQTAADRARQARADADSAEMDAAKKAGVLMFTADAKRLWAGGFVKIRDLISRCRELKPKTKAELSAKLQKIRLEEPEKE